MGKCSNAFHFESTGEIMLLSQDCLISGHYRWPISRFNPMNSTSCHSRSYKVKFVFGLLLQNTDREEIAGSNVLLSQRRIDWYKTWPIRFMTWPHVTLTWGQILTSTFQDQHAYISTSLDRRNTIASELFSSFLSSKVVCEKNHLCQKRLFWHLLTSYSLILWRVCQQKKPLKNHGLRISGAS